MNTHNHLNPATAIIDSPRTAAVDTDMAVRIQTDWASTGAQPFCAAPNHPAIDPTACSTEAEADYAATVATALWLDCGDTRTVARRRVVEKRRWLGRVQHQGVPPHIVAHFMSAGHLA